jgi:transposase
MLTVGLDVHQSRSSICILDAQGNTLRREDVKGGWDLLLCALDRIPKPFQICYEASTGYGALHQRLTPIAAKVVVANPQRVRLIYISKRKTDRIDAAKLAALLHLGQVPAVHVPAQHVRSWRGLIEHRRRLVDKRVEVKNQIRALLRTYGIKAPHSRRLWTQKGAAWLKEVAWPTAIEKLRLNILLEEWDDLNKKITQLVAGLDQIAQDHPGITLLRTIPGVGPRTAEAFVAYVDDPHRFKAGTIGAYFGLVPREDSSGEQRRLGHITREGPGTMRKLLAEAAWRGCQDSPAIKAVFDRLCRNDKHRRKIALVGLAHWLTRVMLAMLVSNKEFRQAPGQVPAPAELADTAAPHAPASANPKPTVREVVAAFAPELLPRD